MSITILDMPDGGRAEKNDILYLLRGTGLARDKQFKIDELITELTSLGVDTTIDLSNLTTNKVYLLDAGVTLTTTNQLSDGLIVKIVTKTNAIVENGIDTFNISKSGFVYVEGAGAVGSVFSFCSGIFGLVSNTSLTDYNLAKNPGTYYLGTTPTNKPDATFENWFGEFIPASGTGIGGIQKAIGFNKNANVKDGKEFYRTFDGVLSWGGWASVGYADKGFQSLLFNIDNFVDGYCSFTSTGASGEPPTGDYIINQEQSLNPNLGSGIKLYSQRATLVIGTPKIYVRNGTLPSPYTGSIVWGAWTLSGNISGDWEYLGEVSDLDSLKGKNGFGYMNSNTTNYPFTQIATFEVTTTKNPAGANEQTFLRVWVVGNSPDAQSTLYQSICTITASDLRLLKENDTFRLLNTMNFDANNLYDGWGASQGTSKNLPDDTTTWAIISNTFNQTGATIIKQVATAVSNPALSYDRRKVNAVWTEWVLNTSIRESATNTNIDIPFNGFTDNQYNNATGTFPNSDTYILTSYLSEEILTGVEKTCIQIATGYDNDKTYKRYRTTPGGGVANWTSWSELTGASDRTLVTYSTTTTISNISSILIKQVNVTTLSNSLTITAPIASQSEDGLTFIYRIRDDGVLPRTLVWNNFTEIGVTLPTTTTLNKTVYVGTIYNDYSNSWEVVALTEQA